jgi:hypothetical protein
VLITKLNEKAFKCNVRTNMLGKDANMVEYWHFKDDATRIYTRVEEVILSQEVDEVSGTQKVDSV